MDVGGDGFGGGADVGEGEVVGDDAAPAVGAEFDLGMGHGEWGVLLERVYRNLSMDRLNRQYPSIYSAVV